MKIIQKISVFILLFFLLFSIPCNTIDSACAKNNTLEIEFYIDNKKYIVNNNKYQEVKLTEYQKKELNNYNLKLKQIELMKQMNFSSEDIVKYLYPYLYLNLLKIIKKQEIESINAEIYIIPNTAKLKIKPEKSGLKLDKNEFFNKILYILQGKYKKFCINTEISYPKVFVEDLIKYTKLKTSFKTNFKTSSEERKNNIKLALKSLDGCIILPNETFSFNKVVGKRSQDNGYMQAKIISNGKFIDSIGGGVCQVSTTLYNSLILSGLEIIEVHSHSLKIGYVEPGFDAMVNGEISDLKFRNNTQYPIIITTSSKDDICNVSIYGIENLYDYKRQYESEILTNDNISDESINIITPATKVKASLLIYKDNELIETRLLREVYYKPLIIEK